MFPFKNMWKTIKTPIYIFPLTWWNQQNQTNTWAISLCLQWQRVYVYSTWDNNITTHFINALIFKKYFHHFFILYIVSNKKKKEQWGFLQSSEYSRRDKTGDCTINKSVVQERHSMPWEFREKPVILGLWIRKDSGVRDIWIGSRQGFRRMLGGSSWLPRG